MSDVERQLQAAERVKAQLVAAVDAAAGMYTLKPFPVKFAVSLARTIIEQDREIARLKGVIESAGIAWK